MSAKIDSAYIKCDGRGMNPVPGTDADGIKGKCPQCPGMITLSGKGMISAHLVGGINAPVSKALTQRNESVRAMGEGSRVIGNNIESAGFVKGIPGGAPLVRGRDMSGEIPVRRTREEAREAGQRRSYAEAAGTMAGSTGRMHLSSGVLDEIAGGRHGWLSTTEVGELSRTQQRRYWEKVRRAKDAEGAAGKRRREFERAHPEFTVTGSGPTAASPYAADQSKESAGMDTKPCHTKYKSEPIFGRTARR